MSQSVTTSTSPAPDNLLSHASMQCTPPRQVVWPRHPSACPACWLAACCALALACRTKRVQAAVQVAASQEPVCLSHKPSPLTPSRRVRFMSCRVVTPARESIVAALTPYASKVVSPVRSRRAV